MVKILFSKESTQKLNTILPKASRDEVRSLIEDLSQKTGAIAQTVLDGEMLEKAFDRMDELEESEIMLNRRISELGRDLSELQMSMNRLTPLEIASKLDLLQEKIFSCPKPSTGLLQRDLNRLKDRFDHLHFRFAFPNTEELNPDSFQNNLLYRIEQKIAHSDPHTAASLRESLSSLQLQCRIAEKIFQGKGLSSYFTLPEAIRLDIEGRLFERFPEQSIQTLLTQVEGSIQIAAAIMASLGDQMMDVFL